MSGKVLDRSRPGPPDQRMLTRKQAAGYCNVSEAVFLSICKVAPTKLGHNVLWDRYALDEWLDVQTKYGANITDDEWIRMLEDDQARA